MAENTKTARAAKAEADDVESIKFTVDVKGENITIKCPADISDAPFEVAEAFEDNKNLRAFMLMIGARQAAELRAAGLTPRIFNDEVIPKWQEAAGLGED